MSSGLSLNIEGVFETRRFERLVPPSEAVFHRGARRLRNRGIEVIDNLLLRLTDRGGGILFLQPMTPNPLDRIVARTRAGVILEKYAFDADPWVRRARHIAGGRLDKAVMQASTEHAGFGSGPSAAIFRFVSYDDFDFAVLWERLRSREINGASIGIELPCVRLRRPPPRAAARRGEACGIADYQWRRVHDYAAAFGFDNRKSGKDRFGE